MAIPLSQSQNFHVGCAKHTKMVAPEIRPDSVYTFCLARARVLITEDNPRMPSYTVEANHAFNAQTKKTGEMVFGRDATTTETS